MLGKACRRHTGKTQTRVLPIPSHCKESVASSDQTPGQERRRHQGESSHGAVSQGPATLENGLCQGGFPGGSGSCHFGKWIMSRRFPWWLRVLPLWKTDYVKEVSLVAQTVKNLPAMQETWVRSLGWEDTLEKGMATHSSVLARRIPWTEEPSRLQSMGLQRVGHN